MNLGNYFNKHQKNQLSDKDWEHLAEGLINAKFDQERRSRLEKKMAEKGIHRQNSKVRNFSFRNVLAIAASFLVLISAGWYLMMTPSVSSAQQFALDALKTPFQLNEGNIRGSQNIEKNRGKALEAYENQRYETALNYLQLIENEGQATANDFFQMGLCLLYQQEPNYENALKAFEKVQQFSTEIYYDETNWYIALCHIMLQNNQQARTYLEKIINSASSRKAKDAQQLLKILNQ